VIINGDGGYGLLAAYIGGPVAQVDWLGPKVGGRLAPFLYSSREPSELSQWLCYQCYDDSTIDIVVVLLLLLLLRYSLPGYSSDTVSYGALLIYRFGFKCDSFIRTKPLTMT